MKNSEPLDIVYISHYYPPEVNAPAARVSELARHWHRAGHNVTVVTGFPNHPTGVIRPEYRGTPFREESLEGVRVLRTWIYAAANKGFVRRILNYLSFMFSAIILGGPRLRRADVIIGTSPQMFVAVAAWILAVWKRAAFVFEVRDVWPEEIRAVGALKNHTVLRVLEWLEMFLYRRADKIVAVAQGTIDILVSRGVPREKLVLIPNGVEAAAWPCDSRDVARKRIGINGEFIASYIGTHGMAHRLNTVLDAARQLSDLPNLTILMVGDGAEKKSLQLRARASGITNVRFMDEVPRNRVADYYAASDVCLVPLRRAELFQKNVPSKIYEIMASSRPIVIGTEGESRALIERAGCGVVVEPENPAELAAAIRELYHSPDHATELGRRGREFVLTNNERAVLAEKYIDSLRALRSRSAEAKKNHA